MASDYHFGIFKLFVLRIHTYMKHGNSVLMNTFVDDDDDHIIAGSET
jgi:hypothetical protein